MNAMARAAHIADSEIEYLKEQVDSCASALAVLQAIKELLASDEFRPAVNDAARKIVADLLARVRP